MYGCIRLVYPLGTLLCFASQRRREAHTAGMPLVSRRSRSCACIFASRGVDGQGYGLLQDSGIRIHAVSRANEVECCSCRGEWRTSSRARAPRRRCRAASGRHPAPAQATTQAMRCVAAGRRNGLQRETMAIIC